MHKCVFSNSVHEILEQEMYKPASQRTPVWKKPQLTDKEKAELFDKIAFLHKKCTEKIQTHQYNKRVQKRKEKKRKEEGYYEKKAAKKEAYENRKSANLV